MTTTTQEKDSQANVIEMNPGALLDAEQLAQRLNLTEVQVWRFTRIGKIPVKKLGRRTYRYSFPEVIAALG